MLLSLKFAHDLIYQVRIRGLSLLLITALTFHRFRSRLWIPGGCRPRGYSSAEEEESHLPPVNILSVLERVLCNNSVGWAWHSCRWTPSAALKECQYPPGQRWASGKMPESIVEKILPGIRERTHGQKHVRMYCMFMYLAVLLNYSVFTKHSQGSFVCVYTKIYTIHTHIYTIYTHYKHI